VEGAQASSNESEPPSESTGSSLIDALDHLLEPVAVVPLRPRAGNRRGPRTSSLRTITSPQFGREVCRIFYWRGYLKSQFVAVTERDGKSVALFASPFFRTRGDAPPTDDVRARRAHAVLREELAQEGWQLASLGDAWYEGTFRRGPSALS
jgi:hypothetical protein